MFPPAVPESYPRGCVAQSAAGEARTSGSDGLVRPATPLEAFPKPRAGGRVVYLSERRTSRMAPDYVAKDL